MSTPINMRRFPVSYMHMQYSTPSSYDATKEHEMSKDTRTPVKVIVKGKFTVKIYDLEAYENAITLYADKENETGSLASVPVKKHRTPIIYEKKKRGFDWTSSYKHSA